MPAALRLVLLLALTALASPVAAIATPPVTETEVMDETFLLPAGTEGNPCPFDLTYHNQGTFIYTTHFDSAGNAVRLTARSSPGHFLETYSANGKEISARSTAIGHLDFATSTLVGTGNQRHFIVPGVGIVFAQAGRFVIDFPDGGIISVSGLDIPQGEEFCAALAP
ncbi:MAG: hypothetical protein ACRDMU_06375 [Gaiellaceae bacterium]